MASGIWASRTRSTPPPHNRSQELEVKHTTKCLTSAKGISLPERQRLGNKRTKCEAKDEAAEASGVNDHTSPAKVRRSGVQDADPANWLPHAYTRLDNTKAPTLEKIATALEDMSFGAYALRIMKGRGVTAVDFHARLLDIIEYDTGFDVSKPPTGDLRHIPTLIRSLQTMRDERGAEVLA